MFADPCGCQQNRPQAFGGGVGLINLHKNFNSPQNPVFHQMITDCLL